MSNVASAFSTQEEAGNGLHTAQYNDNLSSTEDGSIGAHQGSPTDKQAVDESHSNGAHEAQDGHLCSGKIMQEGYWEGAHVAQQGDSKNENLTEEELDDDRRGAQRDCLRNMEESQEGASGLNEPQHGDESCIQMLGAHGDANTEIAISRENASSNSSLLPQLEKPTHAQTSLDSQVLKNSDNFGNLNEHDNQCTISEGEPGRQTNLAACMASGKHPSENVMSAQESGEYVHQNVGTDDRSQEHCNASSMASIGTLGKPTQESEGAHGTLGGFSHKNTCACSTAGKHEDRESFVNADVCAEGDQLGRYPKKVLFGNGNPGEYEQGTVRESSSDNDDFEGNLFDFPGSYNDPDANAHGKMTARNELGGVDFKINLSQSVTSMQDPTLMVSSNKSDSLLARSAYYTTQSGTIKNIGLASRFGSAIFSLVAFSVIISTNEKRVAAGSTFYVKFSDYQAYNYLAALNLLSFLYSSAHVVFRAQARSSNILSSPVKRGASVYLCDQMLALLMISSSSSAATASELSRHGLHNIWPPACSTWKLSLLCSKADVAVAMNFLSFLFILMSSVSSGYYLSNLLAE